jgi:hypothetical protein
MALEWRNGRPYFYTSRRSGRRVVREYGGSGEGAAICAHLSEYYRQDREFEAFSKRADAEELRAENAAVRRFSSDETLPPLPSPSPAPSVDSFGTSLPCSHFLRRGHKRGLRWGVAQCSVKYGGKSWGGSVAETSASITRPGE